MNLANALVDAGHEVLLWSSAFYHQEKRHRTPDATTVTIGERLRIRLVPSRGYSRNIGPGRLIDHAQLAHNLARELRGWSEELPDVAFVGFPPIETAAAMTRWLKIRGIPVMLDAKDQWPTIFVEPLPAALRPVGRVLLQPYFHYARRAMRDSAAYCAMSSEFVDWMCELSGRPRRTSDHVAPLTAPRPVVEPAAAEQAREWWNARGVTGASRRRVTFVGSLSSAFDFRVVREIAQGYLAAGRDCQFVICGEGDESPAVRELSRGVQNMILPGWIDQPKISALMGMSAATVAPYINNDAFMRSIPNKILDSLAAGLPVLTTLQGTTARLVSDEAVGFSSGDAAELGGYLNGLLEDPSMWTAASTNARNVYDRRFSSQKVYGDLVRALEELARR